MSKKTKKPTVEEITKSIAAEQAGGRVEPTDQEKLASMSTLTNEQVETTVKEVKEEKEYGSQNLKAATYATARGLTFGLSDVAATATGLATPEELSKLEKYNPNLSTGFEIAGTVLPVVATGGTGAVAKGAQIAGKGVLAANRAGRVVDVAAQQALRKILKSAGSKSITKKILEKGLSKAAGSAAEASFYTTGHLLSENALGRADLNAENIVGSFGSAALIGGTMGGVLGSFQAVVPILKKGKVTDFKTKPIKQKDVSKSVEGLVQHTKETRKYLERRPDIKANQADFLIKNANLKQFQNPKTFLNAVEEATVAAGKEVDSVLTKIGELSPEIVPARSTFYTKIVQKIDDVINTFDGAGPKDRAVLKALTKERDELALEATKIKPFNMIKIRELKTKFGDAANFFKDAKDGTSLASRRINEILIEELDTMIDSAGPKIGNLKERFKRANLDYATGATLGKSLDNKIITNAKKQWIDFQDSMTFGTTYGFTGSMVIAGAVTAAKKFYNSDVRRIVSIQSAVTKVKNQNERKINTAIASFFDSKTTSKAAKTGTKVGLVDTFFNLPDPGNKQPKKPKTKEEAFRRLKQDLNTLEAQPQILADQLAASPLAQAGVLENTAFQAGMVATRAVQYLKMKIPQTVSRRGALNLLTEDSMPSSIELAKFERIVNAVENPMSIVENLENGQLTRDEVKAVQFVYPNLFMQIQEKAMEFVTDNAGKLSYQKRLQLGILFDVPADTSLLPNNITALQQSFADEEQQQNAAAKEETSGAVPTTQGALQKIDRASKTQTEAQRIATRK